MVKGSGTLWRAVPWVAAVLSFAQAASGQTAASPGVRYRAPTGCPDRAGLVARIEALLGRALRDDEPIAVDGEVRQVGAVRWELTLRDEEGRVERTLEDASCEALTDAAALMAAWTIDPSVEPAALAAPVEAVAAVEPVALEPVALEPVVVEPTVVEPTRAVRPSRSADRALALARPTEAPARRGAPISVGLGALFLLDLGTLPSVSPGFLLEVVLRVERLDLRLRGGWLSAQRAHVDNLTPTLPVDAAIDVEWAGGSVHGCGRPLEGDEARPGLSICAGVHVAALLARGVSVSNPGRGEAPMASLGFGAAMPWSPVDWLDLEVGLELLVPLSPPTFAFEGAPGGFSPSPVGARATLGGHVDVR